MITINHSLLGEITMRELKEIENEIAEHTQKGRELLQERREVKREIAKRNSAVHVIENMGWTYANGKWNKPVNKVVAKPYSQTPLVAGGFATYDHFVLGCSVYVRLVAASYAVVSRVRDVTLKGADVSMVMFRVSLSELTPRDRTYFIGK